ncbi:hypothetical protein [Lysobacter capsici]|uniref:hypothetical protein n=1 Tax=Lysobacter capsici TaxID=435897 RepID=UPI001C00577F|nr:hypothetical protein [Lysobacter capsici]QWF15417.1 hypothetical protein KME82_16710 [Lysobacter capsici]
MKTTASGLVSTLAFLVLGGCANIQTLGRHTATPMVEGKGRAIHLDAQQRLVVFTAKKYCAEPSPDALAAYAAAIGVSASKVPKNSAAISAALNNVAGSIGLRTQSITLMRDTLYRNCEAGINGYLSNEQVAVLLARSQDLTAVILAIEQLTGAVAAPPLMLDTSGGSSAASTLLANTEALKAAEKMEAEMKAARDEAEKQRDDLLAKFDEVKANADRLRSESDAAPDDEGKKTAAVKEEAKTDAAKIAAEAAKTRFVDLDDAYVRQKQTTATISALRDSSVNTVNAHVAGTARAGEFLHRNTIDDKSVEHIADAVEETIRRFLHKDYFADACLAVLMPGAAEARDAAGRAFTENDGSYSRDVMAVVKRNYIGLTYTCLRYFSKYEPHYIGAEEEAARGTAGDGKEKSPGTKPPAAAAGMNAPEVIKARDLAKASEAQRDQVFIQQLLGQPASPPSPDKNQ